jgi:hypothetical protein
VEQVKRFKRSESTWRELFARQSASGLSVPDFCRGEGINAGVFRLWRSVLSGGGKDTERAVRVQPKAAPFIDLGAIGSRASRLDVRLELGAGVVLTVACG